MFLFSSNAFADTIVNSDITKNTRWTTSGSPYLIYTDGRHDIKVKKGVTLKIEPGVTVKFNSRTGRAVTYFFLDTTNSAPDGQWVVEIEIDGEFVRSYAFWILSN